MDASFFTMLNWLSVVIATVAYFLLGALWYSKLLFSKPWIKAAGIDMSNPGARKGVAGIMISTFVLEFIICAGISKLAQRLMMIGGLESAIKLGLVLGLCFAAPVTLISYLYEGKVKTLGLINAGYHIVGILVATIIICA